MIFRPLELPQVLVLALPVASGLFLLQTVWTERRRERREPPRAWGPTLPSETAETEFSRTVTEVGRRAEEPPAPDAAIELEAVPAASVEGSAATERPVKTPARRARRTHAEVVAERAAALTEALDAIVEFVDAAPRRARAEACAKRVRHLVPSASRGVATTLFLSAVNDGVAPAQAQALAEDAAVEIAGALKATRTQRASQ